MALNIVRKSKAEKVYTYREKEINLMADLLLHDDHLRRYFRQHHPIFDFEILEVTDSIVYTVKLRGSSDIIHASSLGFRLSGDNAGLFDSNLFHQSYMSVIRALVFNIRHENTVYKRSNMDLFDLNGDIKWEYVDEYINLSTMLLRKLEISIKHDNEFSRYLISPSECSDIHPMLFSFDRSKLNDEYKVHLSEDRFKANKLLKNHLLIQLSRSLVFDVMSFSEAEVLMSGQDMDVHGEVPGADGVNNETD